MDILEYTIFDRLKSFILYSYSLFLLLCVSCRASFHRGFKSDQKKETAFKRGEITKVSKFTRYWPNEIISILVWGSIDSQYRKCGTFTSFIKLMLVLLMYGDFQCHAKNAGDGLSQVFLCSRFRDNKSMNLFVSPRSFDRGGSHSG